MCHFGGNVQLYEGHLLRTYQGANVESEER
jgi:hypothetical protein